MGRRHSGDTAIAGAAGSAKAVHRSEQEYPTTQISDFIPGRQLLVADKKGPEICFRSFPGIVNLRQQALATPGQMAFKIDVIGVVIAGQLRWNVQQPNHRGDLLEHSVGSQHDKGTTFHHLEHRRVYLGHKGPQADEIRGDAVEHIGRPRGMRQGPGHTTNTQQT